MQLTNEEEMDMECGRCKKEVTGESGEVCWYCVSWLCYDCWEDYGHCGHLEADKANEEAAAMKQEYGTLAS